MERMVDDYVALTLDAPHEPRRVPPLDGEHVSEFDGSGWLLLSGEPLHAVTYRCIPLHVVTCRYMPF